MNTNDDKTFQIIIITLIVLLFYTLRNKHTFTSQHAFKFHSGVTQHFKDLLSLNVIVFVSVILGGSIKKEDNKNSGYGSPPISLSLVVVVMITVQWLCSNSRIVLLP